VSSRLPLGAPLCPARLVTTPVIEWIITVPLPFPSPAGTGSVTAFASPSSWIESDAEHCRQVAALDGMIHVAGMPDLHPGKGAPIGAAMLSQRAVPAPGRVRHRVRHRVFPVGTRSARTWRVSGP
jgi:hypothetical protein